MPEHRQDPTSRSVTAGSSPRPQSSSLASLVTVLFLLSAGYLALAPYPSTRTDVICGSPLLSAGLVAAGSTGFLAPSTGGDSDRKDRNQECPASSRGRLVQAGGMAILGVLSYVVVERLLVRRATPAVVPALVLVPFVAGALFLAFAPYAPKFTRAYALVCGSPILSAASSPEVPHGLLAPVAAYGDIERLDRPLICPTESRGRLVQAAFLVFTGGLVALVARRLVVPDVGHGRAAAFVLLPFLAAAVFLVMAPYVPQDDEGPTVCGSPILSASTSTALPDGFLAPGSVGADAEDFQSHRRERCTTESRGRLVQAAFVLVIGGSAYAMARRVLFTDVSRNRVAAVVAVPIVASALFWMLSPYTPAGTGDPVVVCGVPIVSQVRDATLVPHGLLAPNSAEPGFEHDESAREDECPPQSRTRVVQSGLMLLLAGPAFGAARHYLRSAATAA